MQRTGDLLVGGVGVGLVVDVPVVIGVAPEGGLVAGVLEHRQALLAEHPFRVAEEEHGVAEVLLYIVVELLNLGVHLLRGDGGEVLVVHAVVAHNMPLVDHALHQLGVGFDIVAGDEEHRLDVLFLEDVEDVSGVAVLISLVKGEVDPLLIRPDEVRVVSAVLLLQLQAGDRAVLLVHIGSRAPGDRVGIQLGHRVKVAAHGRIGIGVGVAAVVGGRLLCLLGRGFLRRQGGALLLGGALPPGRPVGGAAGGGECQRQGQQQCQPSSHCIVSYRVPPAEWPREDPAFFLSIPHFSAVIPALL